MTEERIETGSALFPVNGRFAGRLMVAVRVLDGYADVCDGKKRRLEKPKRKKLCHLRLYSSDLPRLTVNAGLTDGEIRRYLSSVRSAAAIPDKQNTIQYKDCTGGNSFAQG